MYGLGLGFNLLVTMVSYEDRRMAAVHSITLLQRFEKEPRKGLPLGIVEAFAIFLKRIAERVPPQYDKGALVFRQAGARLFLAHSQQQVVRIDVVDTREPVF